MSSFMPGMSERDLSRLSYLMASIVAAPARTGRFLDIVQKPGNPPALRDVHALLRSRFAQSAAPTLRDIESAAAELSQSPAGTPENAAGILLARALACARPRRNA